MLKPHITSYACIASLGVLCLLLAGTVDADDMFRWKDSKGNLHFGDRPPADALELRTMDGKLINVVHNDNDSGTRRLNDAVDDERASRSAEDRQRLTEKEQLEQKCNDARNHLERFGSSGFRYTTGKDGSRVIMDEKQDQALEKSIRDEIERYCR